MSVALDKIREVCDVVCADKTNYDTYLLGDLNLNLLVKNPYTTLFSEICGQFSLYSLVNIPTRVSNKTAIAIDVIATSCNKIISSGVIKYNLSDHLILYCVKKHLKHKDVKVKTRVRTFKNSDLDLIKISLTSYNWGRFYARSDVDEAWDEQYKKILIIADHFAPFNDVFIRSNRPGLLTNAIVEDSIERDGLLATYKKIH